MKKGDAYILYGKGKTITGYFMIPEEMLHSENAQTMLMEAYRDCFDIVDYKYIEADLPEIKIPRGPRMASHVKQLLHQIVEENMTIISPAQAKGVYNTIVVDKDLYETLMQDPLRNMSEKDGKLTVLGMEFNVVKDDNASELLIQIV